jgi:DNA-binding PadR family transcriptional regulator
MKAKDLDEILGVTARLAIVATLATLPPAGGIQRWTFMAIRRETELADGNLHVQTQKLVTAGYLSSARVEHGKRTVTCFELTDIGRRALRKFVSQIQDALEGGSGFADLSSDRPPSRPKDNGSQVW